MGQITCELVRHIGDDVDMVLAAQVKESNYDLSAEKITGIIRFMMQNRHGSPFEHAFLKFIVEAPIFVSREHFRHRIGHSYNEISTRYTDIRKSGDPYIVGAEKQVGKTGAYSFEELDPDVQRRARAVIGRIQSESSNAYDTLLNMGVGKQDAGTVFTISHPTRYIWSCNPRSLMHFLSLRNADQARREIRMVAEQAEEIFKMLFPITHAAFVDFGRVAP